MNEKKLKNPMRKIRIEKIAIGVGGIAEELDKGVKLIEMVSNKKAARMKSTRRIPTLHVRPGLEIGAVITLRKDLDAFLKRMLSANDNVLKKKQMSENNFSFGIKEYIEIPGVEYQRDLGIRGFDVTVVFKRSGRRVKLRKIKKGRVGKNQVISKEEIIKFMEEKFNTTFV